MAVTEKNSRSAVTHWRVLERFSGYTLVECKLETGRTHQIRVHLAHLGHPLLGDDLYGGNLARIKRQALRAARLHFRHPMTGAEIDVQVPLPSDMAQIVSDFQR